MYREATRWPAIKGTRQSRGIGKPQGAGGTMKVLIVGSGGVGESTAAIAKRRDPRR